MNASGGVPAMDGAFERFITAAIATIITIMFSWRLLTDVNEYDSTIPIISPPPPRLKHLTEDNRETDDSNDYDNFSDADDEAEIEPATCQFRTFAFAMPASRQHSDHSIPGVTSHSNIPSAAEMSNVRYHSTNRADDCYQTMAIPRTTDIPGGCAEQEISYHQPVEPLGLKANNTAVAATGSSSSSSCNNTVTAAASSTDIKVGSTVRSHPIVAKRETGKTVFTLSSASPLQQVVSPPPLEGVHTRPRLPSLQLGGNSPPQNLLASDDSLMTTAPRRSSHTSIEAPTTTPPCLSSSSTSTNVSRSSLTQTSSRGSQVKRPPPPLPPRRPQGSGGGGGGDVTHTTINNNNNNYDNISSTTTSIASPNDRNTNATNTHTSTGDQTKKPAAAPILGRRAMANNNKNNVANKNESCQSTSSSNNSSRGSSSSGGSTSGSTSSLVCNREFRNIVDDDDFKQMVPSREMNFFRPRHRYCPPPPSPSNVHYYDIDSDSDSDSEVFYFNGLEPIEEEDSDDLSSDSDRCEEYEVKGSYPPSVIHHDYHDDDNNNFHTFNRSSSGSLGSSNSSYKQPSSFSLTGVPARGNAGLLFSSHPGDAAATTTINNRTASLLSASSSHHHDNNISSSSNSTSISSSPRQHGRSFTTENKNSEAAKICEGSSVDTSFTSPYVSSSDEPTEREEPEEKGKETRPYSVVEECDQPRYEDDDTSRDNNNVTYTHATATVEQAPIICPPKQLFNVLPSSTSSFSLSNTHSTSVLTPPEPPPPPPPTTATVDNVISTNNIPVQHMYRGNNNGDTINYTSKVCAEEQTGFVTMPPPPPPSSDHYQQQQQQQQESRASSLGQVDNIDSTSKQTTVRSTEELSNSLKKSSVTARPLSQTIGDLSDTSRDLTTYNENALLTFTTSTNERSQRIKDDSVNPAQTPQKSRERSYSDGDVNPDEETCSSPSESTHGLMLDIRANATTKEETESYGDEFLIMGKNNLQNFQTPSPDVYCSNQSNWPIQLYFDATKSNAAENPPRGFTFSYSEPGETAYKARSYYVENYDNNSNTLNNNNVHHEYDDRRNMSELNENNNLSADDLKFTPPRDYVDNPVRFASDDINVFTASKLDNGPVIITRALSMTEAEPSRQPDNYTSLEQQNRYLSNYKEPESMETTSSRVQHGEGNQPRRTYSEQEAVENVLQYDGLTEKDLYINKYSDYVQSDYVTLVTLEKSYPDILKKGSFIENSQDINSNDYVREESMEDSVFPDVVKKDTYPVSSSHQGTVDHAHVSTFPDVLNKGIVEKTEDVISEDFTVLECKEKRPFPDIVDGQAYHVNEHAGYGQNYSVMQEAAEKTGFPDIVNREEFHLDRHLQETQQGYTMESKLLVHQEPKEYIIKNEIPVDYSSRLDTKEKPSSDSTRNSSYVSHVEMGAVLKPPSIIKNENLARDTYSLTTSVDPVRKVTVSPESLSSSELGLKTEPTASEELVSSMDSEVEFEVFKSECLAHSEDYSSLLSLEKLDESGNMYPSQHEMSSNKADSENYEGSLSLEEYDELADLVSDQLSPPPTSALHRPLTVNTHIGGGRQVPLVRRKINAVRKRYFGSENNVSDLVEDENSVSNRFARYRKTSLRALKRRDAAKRLSLHNDPEAIHASRIRPSKSLSHISQLYLRSEPVCKYPRPPFHEIHPDCILSPGNADNLEESIQAASIDNLESCLSQYDSFCSLVETDIDTGETTERRFSFDSEAFEIPFSFQQSYFGKSTSLMDLRSEQQQVRRSTGKSRFADRNVPKSKSMQTLETNLDDDDDEDDLLGESSFRRVPSIHELRVSRSLQKLNVPAWYKNSSVSRSGSCILNRDNDSMKSFDWRFNASLTSSPASSIISHQAPVVIKTRVTPSYTRSYSAPLKTPKLVLPPKPANVRLPSDQFRNQEKPKGLMPIPIVPFLKIREMFEKKSQENNSQPTFPAPVSPVSKTPVKNSKPEPPKRITPVKPDSISQSKKSPVSPGFSPALRIDEAIEETNEEEELMEDAVDAVSYSYTSTQPNVTPVKYEIANVSAPGPVTLSTAPPLTNGNSTHVPEGRHVYFNNSPIVETCAEVSNHEVHEQYHTVDQAAPIIRRPVARRPVEADIQQQQQQQLQQQQDEPSAKATLSESKAPSETETTQDDSESKEKSRKVVKVSERVQMYDQASSSKEPEKNKASKEKDWKPKIFSFRDNKVAKSQPKQTPPQPPPPKAKLPVPFFRNRKETTV
ncbi:Hypothetical predicted protein [Octopus vulgaris]|uniref:Uncharacterized protein n=1 Tax=Octopus vulgaris TaxID=6645 RepID=A0AA36AIR9_OCTVU|nr:Hypothetical predicted protein [Octopus vulgaris]